MNQNAVVTTLIGLALAATASGALAQKSADGRDFCANRPGKGTPTCILDVGRLQVEGDLIDSQRDRQAGVRTIDNSYADFQLRFGLTRRAELEASWAPFLTERVHGPSVATRASGSGDLTLGLRYAVTNPDGKGAAVALQPFVTAPTGTHGFGAGDWQGGVVIPISLPITDMVSLSLSPTASLARDAGGGGTHLAWSGAVGVGESFGPVTLGLEVWGARDQDPAGVTTQESVDLMAAWAPKALSDTQFDIGWNTGLNRNTPRNELYAGIAKRF